MENYNHLACTELQEELKKEDLCIIGGYHFKEINGSGESDTKMLYIHSKKREKYIVGSFLYCHTKTLIWVILPCSVKEDKIQKFINTKYNEVFDVFNGFNNIKLSEQQLKDLLGDSNCKICYDPFNSDTDLK